MSQTVKYCLVFWKNDKTVSVLEEPEELKKISDGNEADLIEHGVSYKIIIVARSGEYKFFYN